MVSLSSDNQRGVFFIIGCVIGILGSGLLSASQSTLASTPESEGVVAPVPYAEVVIENESLRKDMLDHMLRDMEIDDGLNSRIIEQLLPFMATDSSFIGDVRSILLERTRTNPSSIPIEVYKVLIPYLERITEAPPVPTIEDEEERPWTTQELSDWKDRMYIAAGFSSTPTSALSPGFGIYPKTLAAAKSKFGAANSLVDVRFEVGEHRLFYGGPWSRGVDSFNFLLQQGLKPHHQMLAVGCGSLRSGIHYIRYLEKGHYRGVDADELSLRAGVEFEIPMAGLQRRDPHIVMNKNFDLVDTFGAAVVDFAIAFQVFKASMNSALVTRGVCQMRSTLKEDGVMFLVGPLEVFHDVALSCGLVEVDRGMVPMVYVMGSTGITYVKYSKL